MKPIKALLFLAAAILLFPAGAKAADLTSLDRQVLDWTGECRDALQNKITFLVESGKLTKAQVFDTFYIPIPNTDPQKYHTQYDAAFDAGIQGILDICLQKNKNIAFVVAVDKNGYLPTHNSKYSMPLTGNSQIDVLKNRTKRIFDDRTGLAAARNTQPYLLQKYSRDTGEQMADLSMPVFLFERHWGALRFGYYSGN